MWTPTESPSYSARARHRKCYNTPAVSDTGLQGSLGGRAPEITEVNHYRLPAIGRQLGHFELPLNSILYGFNTLSRSN